MGAIALLTVLVLSLILFAGWAGVLALVVVTLTAIAVFCLRGDY